MAMFFLFFLSSIPAILSVFWLTTPKEQIVELLLVNYSPVHGREWDKVVTSKKPLNYEMGLESKWNFSWVHYLHEAHLRWPTSVHTRALTQCGKV